MNTIDGRKPIRYGQMSEEEAAEAFESRKRQLYSELQQCIRKPKGYLNVEKTPSRFDSLSPQRKTNKVFIVYANKEEAQKNRPRPQEALKKSYFSPKPSVTSTSKSRKGGLDSMENTEINLLSAERKQERTSKSNPRSTKESCKSPKGGVRPTRLKSQDFIKYYETLGGQSPYGGGYDTDLLEKSSSNRRGSIEIPSSDRRFRTNDTPQARNLKKSAFNLSENRKNENGRLQESEGRSQNGYSVTQRPKYQNKGEYLFETGLLIKQQTKEKTLAQKTLHEKESLKGCTFKPELISKPVLLEEPETLAEKTRKWQENQKWKNFVNLKVREAKEVDGCTFHPNINVPTTSKANSDPLNVFQRTMEWKDRRLDNLQRMSQKPPKDSSRNRTPDPRSPSQPNRNVVSPTSGKSLKKKQSPGPNFHPKSPYMRVGYESNNAKTYAETHLSKSPVPKKKNQILNAQRMTINSSKSPAKYIREEIDETIQIFCELEELFGKKEKKSQK
eukprot:TRINITY_DN2473_c0_g1_i3.p1 TRINITY_DN2473_c0_g1~~TRINITY_DN2473_c0_g1_i3.p1  ORF type:complete len:501 (+),score=76.62 TRINITY_DN2473_c0_g1_i3:269-1771(+)